MQFLTLLAQCLAFTALTDAFKYKKLVTDTTELNIEKFLTMTARNSTMFNGHNLQLMPAGPKPTDFNAAIDMTSTVLIYTLFKGNLFSQMVGRRGFKATRVHAGLRDRNPINGGNTTVREVYFSKDTEQGDGFFALFHVPTTPGLYFLTHSVVIPQGVKRVVSGFALCPRMKGAYYQLVFLVSNGSKLMKPHGCRFVGVGTILAPTPAQLKGNSKEEPMSAMTDEEMEAAFTRTHYADGA